jgi:periplasmic divalent cation tolerance protein
LDQNDKPVLIYSTFPSAAEAERIGGALVDRGLAACVNILPGMTSIYIWEGRRQRDAESAMIIKTRARLADAAIAEARKLHPYSNPAFVVLLIDGGSTDFLRWIGEQTAQPARSRQPESPTQ